MKIIWLIHSFLFLFSVSTCVISMEISLEPVTKALKEASEAIAKAKDPKPNIFDEAAKLLSESLGENCLKYLKAAASQIDLPSNPQQFSDLRVVIRAIVHLDPEQAVERLLEIADNKDFASFAAMELSLIDHEEAKKALEQIATTYSNPIILAYVMSGLRWLGDEESAALLSSLAKSKLYEDSSKRLLFSAKAIEYRLNLSSEEEQKVWQSYHKTMNETLLYPSANRNAALGFFESASNMAKKGKYPFEFLRQYVEDAPEPFCAAIFLMGIQKEKDAVPILEKHSKDTSIAGECARKALEILSKEESK